MMQIYWFISFHTVTVIEMSFTQGSIIADIELDMELTENTTDAYLQETFKTNYNYLSNKNFTVDLTTLTVAETTQSGSAVGGTDLVIIGVVSGVVLAFVVTVVLVLVIMHFCHNRKNWDRRRSSLGESLPNLIPHMQNLHWQPMGPFPEGHQFDNYAYDQQRIRNITRATNRAPKVDWSVLGSFANNKSDQMAFRGDGPVHRGSPPYQDDSNKDPTFRWTAKR